MISLEVWALIRHLHRSEGLSQRAIGRQLAIARDTVAAAVASGGPPKYDTRSLRTARLHLLSEALTAAMEYLDAAILRRAADAAKAGATTMTKTGMESMSALAARYAAASTAGLLARHKLEVIGGVKSSADVMGAFLVEVAGYHRGQNETDSVNEVQMTMHTAFENDSKTVK